MSLIEIKKKITSTKNTRKITKALQLVAASKMKKFQKQAESSRAYAFDLLAGLHASAGAFEQQSFAKAREEGKTLFVLITSDKGLCGALNTKLIRTWLRSEEWKNAKEKQVLTVGKKATEAAKREGAAILASFNGIDEQMDALKALEIIDPIVAAWESGDIKNVILISPHYVNAFTAHPTIKHYLPFSMEMIGSHLAWSDPEKAAESKERMEIAKRERNIIYEPTEDELIEKLSEQLVQMLFIQAFFELKASEYSSRMVAMKKATEAADDIIATQTREFNKARQAAITQSLAELAAAGAAIK